MDSGGGFRVGFREKHWVLGVRLVPIHLTQASLFIFLLSEELTGHYSVFNEI
jgi:hypothetical protein